MNIKTSEKDKLPTELPLNKSLKLYIVRMKIVFAILLANIILFLFVVFLRTLFTSISGSNLLVIIIAIIVSSIINITGQIILSRRISRDAILPFEAASGTILFSLKKKMHDRRDHELSSIYKQLINNQEQQENECFTIKLQGKGTDFLELFLKSINRDTLIIDKLKFQNHDNASFQIGFEFLASKMLHSKRGWCTSKNGEFMIRPEKYDEFYRWIINEIVNQAKQEETLGKQFKSEQSTKDIQINISFFMPSSDD
jgi:hypothetical protein